jgi:hypothetical protein
LQLLKTSDDIESEKLVKGMLDSIMGIINKLAAMSGEEESFRE